MDAAVTLSDSLVAALLTNRKVVAELPGLRAAVAGAAKPAARAGTCRPCQARRAAAAVNYDALKRSIARLPESEQKRVKKALGVVRLRVVTRDPRTGAKEVKEF